jgi:prolyl-tRNA synthetase
MRLSQYFIPTLKEKPSEAEIASHILMLKAGMIRQSCSGIYSWMPLGLKVLNKISDIVRSELSKVGCIELLMPILQPFKLWQESGRSDAYGKEKLTFPDRNENLLVFGPTCEELITDLFRGDIKSYKQLPKNFFHIQWKFRDEIRPRYGVMRGREFLMKDGYSFDVDKESAIATYKKMFLGYLATFKALGLKAIPVLADSGEIGGNLCHEFQILASTGESVIHYDKALENLNGLETFDYITNLYAAASEKHDEHNEQVLKENIATSKAIEVGHIFYYGTKYTTSMKALVQGADGEMIAPHSGCYGIGVSRLVGAIIEANHDDRGIKWPKEVSPFALSLVNLDVEKENVTNYCDLIYNDLIKHNIDVLYDDTKNSAGSKFANHDLIGNPWQVIVGDKFLRENKVEIKNRYTMERYTIDKENILTHIMEIII